MPRPLDTRLDREEGRRTADAAERGLAAIRRRHIWRAEAKIGAVIRSALARAGIDAAQATRLCVADQAAAALAEISDAPEVQRVDGGSPAQDRGREDPFKAKILALARGLPEGRHPTSPKPLSLNCTPGHSPSRRRNNAALAAGTPPLAPAFSPVSMGAWNVDDCRGAAPHRTFSDRPDA